MNLPPFQFKQPKSLDEVTSLLQEYGDKAAILAGGTILIVALRYRLIEPTLVICLKELKILNHIYKNDKAINIGSMVPLEVLERSEIIKNEYPSLISVIQKIAVPPIRNQATIGGNICLDNRCIFYNQSEFWRSVQKPCFKLGGELCHAVEKGKRCQAVYSGDLAPFLIALGANVKIISKEGEKLIKLSEFFTGRGEKPNILKPNELLTEIQIPPAEPGVGLSYEKLRIREGMDFPMAGVAVKVKEKQDGTIEKIKVVLGSVGTAPIEVSKATTILAEQKLTEELLQKISKETMEVARPVGNLIINSEYRRKMIGVLTKRALIQAFKMAKGNWS